MFPSRTSLGSSVCRSFWIGNPGSNFCAMPAVFAICKPQGFNNVHRETAKLASKKNASKMMGVKLKSEPPSNNLLMPEKWTKP